MPYTGKATLTLATSHWHYENCSKLPFPFTATLALGMSMYAGMHMASAYDTVVWQCLPNPVNCASFLDQQCSYGLGCAGFLVPGPNPLFYWMYLKCVWGLMGQRLRIKGFRFQGLRFKVEGLVYDSGFRQPLMGLVGVMLRLCVQGVSQRLGKPKNLNPSP